MVTGVRPDQYLDFAALRGDPSDNLPGVPGIGPKTAARLLAEFGGARAAFDDATGDGVRSRAALGRAVTARLAAPEARAVWELNCTVMSMVDSAPLGLDLTGGAGCLPLAEEDVRRSFARLELHVPSAIRALTGKEPSAPRPADVDAAWRPPSARTTKRHPPLSAPRVPEPTSVQQTLF